MDNKRCGVGGGSLCEGAVQEANCTFRGCSPIARRCRLHGAGGKLARVLLAHITREHSIEQTVIRPSPPSLEEQLLSDFEMLRGCGDSSCFVKRGTGMMTNGGCRCFKDLWRDMDTDQRIKVRLLARMARAGYELAKERS